MKAMRLKTPKTSSLTSKSKNNNNKSDQQNPTESRQPPPVAPPRAAAEEGGCCGRERLKRHWVEVAGRVWIPDIWGQEDLLKDWIDCSAFDSSLVGISSIMSARESMVEQATRRSPTSTCRFRIHNTC